MIRKTLKVNSKDLKEVIVLGSILTFKLLLVKTLIQDSDNTILNKHSDF